MMRSVFLFAGLLLANAADETGSLGQGQCYLDGARAVDDLMDSATYIWASVKRCGGGASKNAILCSLDISESIESVNAMMNVILKAVDKCGGLQTANAKCGLAVGVLTRSFAGLAAATSGIVAKCPNALNNNQPLTPLVQAASINQGLSNLANAANVVNAGNTYSASLAQCFVDVKDLTKSLFKATKRVMTIKESCADGKEHCAHNSLKVVAAFASMGEFLAGAVGRCQSSATLQTAAGKKLYTESQCASESLQLVQHMHNVGRASVDLHRFCETGAQRLFELEHGGVEMQNGSSSSMTLVLAALLPLAAVLGFAGGSRFGKLHTQTQTQDIDPLIVEE